MKLFKFFLLVEIVSLGTRGSLKAQQQMPPYGSAGNQVGVAIEVDNGFNFGYFEYLPKDFSLDSQQLYPLLIFFHGLGEKGDATYSIDGGTYSVDTGLKRILRKPKRNNGELILNSEGEIQYYLRHEDPPSMINADARGFPAIVISPQSRRGDGQFTPTDFEEIFDFITSKYPVDPSRIYITGLSAGGGSTWKALRSKYYDHIAAAVPICGAGSVADPSEQLQQTAIWTHHNFSDGTVGKGNTISNVNRIANIGVSCMDVYPYNSGANAADTDVTMHFDPVTKAWQASNGINPPTRKMAFTLYNSGGHNAWLKTYQNQQLWDWLFSQVLGATIVPVNTKPIADAGVDQRVDTSNIILDGSKSFDDKQITEYLWTQLAGERVSFGHANEAITEVSGLTQGSYEFVLTVKDAEGLFDNDTVIVQYNQASTYLKISANDPAGERIFLYNNQDKSNSDQLSINYPNNNKVSFAIKRGQLAVLDWERLYVGLTIGYQNQEIPMSDIIDKVGTEWVYVSVPLTAFNHDSVKLANDGISNFYLLSKSNFGVGEFYLDEIKIHGGKSPLLWYGDAYSLSGEPSSVEQTALNFTLTAMVDQQGYVVNSFNAANQVPVADAGLDQQLTVNYTSLDGSRSSGDAGIVKYFWEQTAGPIVQIENASKAIADVANLVEGNYTFSLTVTDAAGETDTDELAVMVNTATNNQAWLRVTADYPAGERIYLFYDSEKSNSNEQSVGFPENTMLSFKIKANNESAINWDNLYLGLTVGYQSREQSISNYTTNFGKGEWVTISIPLTSLGHDLSKWQKRGVSQFYLLAKNSLGVGYFEIDEIVITGSKEPFLWYGDAYQASGESGAIDVTAHNFRITPFSTAARSATTAADEMMVPPSSSVLSADQLREPLREVKIYPNPNFGKFTVELGENTFPVEMNLFDHMGKLIYSTTFSGSQQIDLTGKPAGLYVVQLKQKNGSTLIRRVSIH